MMAPNIVQVYFLAFLNWLAVLIRSIARYFNLYTDKQSVEDVYLQLIRTKSFDEAEKLSLQHKFLDPDIVHQCKWRSSGVTVQSIHSILGRVQDKLWSINECVDTVPISYEACKTLIQFGLKEASLKLLYQLGNEETYDENQESASRYRSEKTGKPTTKQSTKQAQLPDDISDTELEALIDFDHLNKRQKELCRCRLDLLHHDHTLLAYESILGDYRTIQQHFDHVFYEEFRRKSPLNVCLDYAHDGDSHAVEMLLNFFTTQLSTHLLAILSNFPETLSPYLYRNLLPCIRENETTFEWRVLSGQIKKEEFDWCNRGIGYSDFLDRLRLDSETYEREFYKENAHLKKYLRPLDSQTLTQWYIERALEIESRTLLMTSAIQLLNLGTELNIRNLQDTCDNLIEFDRILYDYCSDLDIYLSFSDIKNKTEVERLIPITGDFVKNYKTNMEGRYKLLAFALAHCEDPDGDTSSKILDHVIELRKRDEKLQIAYLESYM